MSSLLRVKAPIREAAVMLAEGDSFTVRGLNPVQVFALFQRHSGEMSALFARVIDSVRANGSIGNADVETMVVTLIQETPVLLAELIAVASGGNPADRELVTITVGDVEHTMESFEAAVFIASQLTFPVQVDAVVKIADLTFTSDMPPGKFLTLVADKLGAMTGAIRQLSQQA